MPETLIPALDELERDWLAARADPAFGDELDALLRDYVGPPDPALPRARLSELTGGEVWLKREDLHHTGSHKINNALGQALLAQRMGKPRVIAETGAGQHGVAAATACALLGLECVVYMGTEDMRRQQPNVAAHAAARRRGGGRGGRRADAQGGGVGGDPRLGRERRDDPLRDRLVRRARRRTRRSCATCSARSATRRAPSCSRQAGRLPDRVIACVGGGSNAIGTFIPFVDDAAVELIGVEAAGEGLDTRRHSAPLTTGARGVLHGALSAVLQDEEGQILEAHSISAGLDYPGVGPEHAWLRDSGRVRYVAVPDGDALAAFRRVAELEGILPALEPAARDRVAAGEPRRRGSAW